MTRKCAWQGVNQVVFDRAIQPAVRAEGSRALGRLLGMGLEFHLQACVSVCVKLGCKCRAGTRTAVARVLSSNETEPSAAQCWASPPPSGRRHRLSRRSVLSAPAFGATASDAPRARPAFVPTAGQDGRIAFAPAPYTPALP